MKKLILIAFCLSVTFCTIQHVTICFNKVLKLKREIAIADLKFVTKCAKSNYESTTDFEGCVKDKSNHVITQKVIETCRNDLDTFFEETNSC